MAWNATVACAAGSAGRSRRCRRPWPCSRRRSRLRKTYRFPTLLMAYFLSAAGFSVFFRGTMLDALCAGLSGVATGLCLYFMNKLHANLFFKTVGAGFVLAFFFGPWAGDCRVGPQCRCRWRSDQYGLLMQCLACFVGSTGFCMLLNLHGSGMFLCIVGGIFSLLSYRLFCYLGVSDLTAFFLAAAALSVYSEIMARVRKYPATSYLLVALFPPWSPVRTSITPWITPSGATPMRSFGTAFTLALWRVPWRLAFSWFPRPSACGASGGTGRKWANYLSIIRRREGWPLWPPLPGACIWIQNCGPSKESDGALCSCLAFSRLFSKSFFLNCLYNCCNILLVIFREEVFGDDGQQSNDEGNKKTRRQSRRRPSPQFPEAPQRWTIRSAK